MTYSFDRNGKFNVNDIPYISTKLSNSILSFSKTAIQIRRIVRNFSYGRLIMFSFLNSFYFDKDIYERKHFQQYESRWTTKSAAISTATANR